MKKKKVTLALLQKATWRLLYSKRGGGMIRKMTRDKLFIIIVAIIGFVVLAFYKDISFSITIAAPFFPALLTLFHLQEESKKSQERQNDFVENNLIRQRYLNDGIDQYINNAERLRQIYKQNYDLVLSITDQIKECSIKKGLIKDLQLSFDQVNYSILSNAVGNRVNQLAGKTAPSEIFKHLFEFVKNFKYEIDYNLIPSLSHESSLKGTFTVDTERVGDVLSSIIAGHNEYDQYLNFINQLIHLQHILEQSRLTFKTIESFKDSKGVKEIICTLEEIQNKIKSQKT